MNKTIFLEKDLKCRLCDRIYNDPIVVDCGETCCRKCIQKTISSENENEFKCPLCSQTHLITQHGFISNKFVKNLVEKNLKENEINLDDSDFIKKMNLQQLKFNLKTIQFEIDKINEIVKYPSEDLNEYCTKLKHQIQLSTENKIQLLNRFNNELVSRVDEYQLENKQEFNPSQIEFKYMEEFCDKWNQKIDLDSFDEYEISDAINKSNNYKSFLQSFLPFVRLNNLKDSEFILDFNEHKDAFINSSVIGYVEYNRRAIKNFETLDEIDLSNFSTNQKGSSIKIIPLENGHYIVAYLAFKNSQQMTALTIVNSEFQKLHKVYLNHELDDIKMFSFKESIMILIKEELKKILFYDLNLYFIKETKLPPYPNDSLVFLDDSNIFMYSKEEPTKTYFYKCNFTNRRNIPKLLLFSMSLIHIPFEETCQVESFELKLYFRHENKISIVDQRDGSFVNTINGITDKCDFIIDRKSGCLITFDTNMKKLLYFTSRGVKFYDYEVKNLPNENFNICYNKLNGLLLYLSETAKVYI